VSIFQPASGRRPAVHESVADETDGPAESVELVTKGREHFHSVDFLLDMTDLPEQLFPLLGGQGRPQVLFEHQQLRVAVHSFDSLFEKQKTGKK
jgi:hypothetical protein